MSREQQPTLTPESLRAPTVTDSGRRRWIYPDRRSGPISRLRGRIAAILVLIYIAAPFIRINGLPLIRIDVTSGVAYLGGTPFFWHETAYLVYILLILAFLLFFTTALRGRIWCGYACPQTVFVEWLIRPIEEWIEGSAHHRRHLDHNPKTPAVIIRKLIKHTAFLAVSTAVAHALLAYFVEPVELLQWMRSSPFDHPYAFTLMLVVLMVVYFDLAWFREQFCSFLCPYARFQSVMLDRWTPTVLYDSSRGEPRGKRNSGACINCQLCVRVCPTGIDIRDGLQLECIQCGRCIDACNRVMASLNRPLDLIRVDRPAAIEAPKPEAATKIRRLRPWVYGCGIAILVMLLAATIARRQDIGVTLLRQPGSTYSRFADGQLGNLFVAKLVNRSQQSIVPKPKLRVEKSECQAQLICPNCNAVLPPGQHQSLVLMVRFPADQACERIEISFNGRSAARSLPLLQP